MKLLLEVDLDPECDSGDADAIVAEAYKHVVHDGSTKVKVTYQYEDGSAVDFTEMFDHHVTEVER